MAKKKGGKKGGNKKGGGALGDLLKKKEEAAQEAAAAPEPEPYTKADVVMHSLKLIETYKKATGEPLLTGLDISTAAKALYEADFLLLSHGSGDNPHFDYANKKALEVFEMTWAQMQETPSSKSAADAAEIQEDRRRALAQAETDGVCKGYSGLRVSTSGREFRIEDGVIWTLLGADDQKVGQAAFVPKWKFTDEPDDEEAGEIAAPTHADLEAAEAAVAAQGEKIRELKSQGLGNKDPDVLAEVELLLEMKKSLEELAEKMDA
ncbi:hypothetical protein CYMTET_38430 [Cymbomonas tetramitiformis]|uniref:WHEP-TRS domain-containing protein n=1 Tax=Cymbomonas tetramitiformis TaxID=36881 RepID=A0AAE0CEA4_9CHLO|nr:hypothetical protein CYMTET_38430 [Cymbomonas tetramitiformis]